MGLHIGRWIRGWRLDKFLAKIFSGNSELKDIAEKAVVLVQQLKLYAENPKVDMLTSIIPSDWDDKLVAKVRAVFPVVLAEYAKHSLCLNKPTTTLQALCIIESITSNPNADERTKLFHELAGKFGVAISDGKFTLSDLFLFVEPIFRLLFGKKK